VLFVTIFSDVLFIWLTNCLKRRKRNYGKTKKTSDRKGADKAS